MKNRHFLLEVLLLVFSVSAFAQNKIGDNPTVIHAGSLLELESLTKGFRLPRIPLNDLHVWTLDGTATSGMLVFNDSGKAPKGLYYWNTDLAQWVQVLNFMPNQVPFFDASTPFNGTTNTGKGLVFPQTDLTTFTFITSAIDGTIGYDTLNGLLRFGSLFLKMNKEIILIIYKATAPKHDITIITAVSPVKTKTIPIKLIITIEYTGAPLEFTFDKNLGKYPALDIANPCLEYPIIIPCKLATSPNNPIKLIALDNKPAPYIPSNAVGNGEAIALKSLGFEIPAVTKNVPRANITRVTIPSINPLGISFLGFSHSSADIAPPSTAK